MQDLEQSVQQHLALQGIRLTRGRRTALGAIAAADGPRTAAEIQAELTGELPLSSLYRSLAVLTSAGVLSAQHGPEGVMRFELAEWLAGHHHHLVCVSCGIAVDVAPDRDQEQAIQLLIERMAAASGFVVTGHRFEIEGLCEPCR
jgi:Fur family transcriptional regulator, ferric uptake regulator